MTWNPVCNRVPDYQDGDLNLVQAGRQPHPTGPGVVDQYQENWLGVTAKGRIGMVSGRGEFTSPTMSELPKPKGNPSSSFSNLPGMVTHMGIFRVRAPPSHQTSITPPTLQWQWLVTQAYISFCHTSVDYLLSARYPELSGLSPIEELRAL